MISYENRIQKKGGNHPPQAPRTGGRLEIGVEALVAWAYADQRADLASGVLLPGWGGGGVYAMGQLGCVVQGGGGGPVRLHEDAEAVDDAVRALDRDSAVLVAMHGRVRSRPDWRPGARWRMEPVEWHLEPGAVPGVWLRVPVVSRAAKGQAEWVSVREADRPAEIERLRGLWTDWVSGLAQVRLALLDRQLRAHRLTDELPAQWPWVGA